MDFESANKYLTSFISYERFNDFSYTEKNFDLERFRGFLKEYEVDYSKLKYVHIAGSKGKGTTANIIAAYLYKSGSKTGLFTSPHLFSLTERIKINGKEISKKRFCVYLEELKKFLKSHDFNLTYFEVLTVIAFKFFIDEKVDYAILEVGLGGRLDSTNVVCPEVSALTSMEMEHVGILGNNMSEILDEKLGIYKAGVPFIIGAQKKNVEKMIKEKMKGKNLRFIKIFGDADAGKKNSALAKEVIKNLLHDFDDLFFEKIARELKLPGHFDSRIIKGKPVVFDVAHTKESFRELIGSLKKNFPKKEFVFLISLMKGKNIKGIAPLVCKAAKAIVFTSSNKERGFTGEELKKEFRRFFPERHLKMDVEESPQKAFENAWKALRKNQMLVIVGSHFLIGLVLKKTL